MLLTVDIGNTNIVCGVFERDRLLKCFRIGTNRYRTSDEYGIILLDLLRHSQINVQGLSGAIISCVVPHLLKTFVDTLLRYFYMEPLIVGPDIELGMPVLCRKPEEVGADRLVNAIAGFEIYKEALIVVDLGTATTFDYVTERGEYAGGVIAPGIMVSLEALFKRASKLPRVGIVKPDSVIGKDTVSSMQSGIFHGYSALIDGVIDRIKKEVGGSPKVIATGGLATFIREGSLCIDEVEPELILHGLRVIYYRNQP